MGWFEKLDRWGWIGPILSVLFVAVMWWPWLHPIILAIYQDPNAAPWAQALGSILAVCVAIWFSRSDSRERKIERRSRAAAYAVCLTPAVAGILNYLRLIDECNSGGDYGLAYATRNTAGAIELFATPPCDGHKAYGEFSALDVGTAQSVVTLLTASRDINQYVKSELCRARGLNANQRDAYVTDMERKVSILRQTAEPLQERLNEIMDQSAADALSG